MASRRPTTIAAYIQAAPREGQPHSKNCLQIPYNKSLPENLVRWIAEHRRRVVHEREDDALW